MTDQTAETGYATNYLAPDGYRYGVKFHDGSVADYWNGRTQRERAEEHAVKWTEQVREWASGRRFIDSYTVVRRLPDGPWEVASPPGQAATDE